MYKKSLNSFAIGIRFRPNFQITDNFGNIINDIVNAGNTVFDTKFFPQVNRDNPNQIILHETDYQNRQFVHKLTIDQQIIVLECKIDNLKDSKKLRQAFVKELMKKIFKNFEITGIQRIGLLHTFEYQNEEFNKKFLTRILDGTMENLSDINLGFSKRIPVPRQILTSENNNYYNVIYQMNKRIDNNVQISIDYQLYYNLPLTVLDQINYDQFFNSADKYLQNDYENWIKGYIK